MFPKVAPKFFAEREKGPISSDSFALPKASADAGKGGAYTVNVNGQNYNVTSGPAGDNMSVTVDGTTYNVAFSAAGTTVTPAATGTGNGADIKAPVAGTLLKHVVASGSEVKEGDTIIMVESMKMELEVKATASGKVEFTVQPGSAITAGQVLGTIGGGAAVVAAPAQDSAPAASAGASVVAAPVAGTFLKGVVAEGASVKAGDTVCMIESMKMELEVKAATDGTIHFLATAGSAITAGQPLAEIN
jgi:oxaloacetate decarboxylase alpha subunit